MSHLRTVLLTTDTIHHAYYVAGLLGEFGLDAVFLETRSAQAPFETIHPFEALRDEYEREHLLEGRDTRIDDLCPTIRVRSMNESAAVSKLRALDPEVVLVFGTGRLRKPVIEVARRACLNMHGGNPEDYRGLDSHLWAIYHRDFANLLTTVHHVDEELDTGDIVGQTTLPITSSTGIHQLRAINTVELLHLTRSALRSVGEQGWLPARRQLTRGRYYSFMPAVLKEDCQRKFERYVTALDG